MPISNNRPTLVINFPVMHLKKIYRGFKKIKLKAFDNMVSLPKKICFEIGLITLFFNLRFSLFKSGNSYWYKLS
jgi:hypothetical protein